MADLGQARSSAATASAASGYQHPFVAAHDFGEARKYTALGSFLQPSTGGGQVRLAAQIAGASTASGDLRLAVAVAAASVGSAAVSGRVLFETLTLAGSSAGAATVGGQLGLAELLAGNAAGQSSTSGDLRAVRAIGGQVDGAAAVTGWLYVPGLAAVVNASGQASGHINLTAWGIGGRADGGVTVEADVTVKPAPPGELKIREASRQPASFRR